MEPEPTVEPVGTVRSAREYFGRRLRHRRLAAGLSQVELGRLVGYDHSYISKVEGGRRWPSPGLPERCDEVLGAGGELAALWPSIEDERRRAMTRETSAPSASSSGAGGPELGHELIDGLATLLDAYDRFDGELGGGAIIDAVESHLRTIAGWLTSANGSLRTPLLRLAARYAYRAGWIRFEKGQHGRAIVWFERALSWATAAGAPTLAADAQIKIGVIVRAEGDQAGAFACAKAGRVLAGGSPSIAFVASILESRAHAALGERTATERLLDHAAKQVDRADPAEVPWLSGCYARHMFEVATAACYRDLAARSGRRTLAHRAVGCVLSALDRTPVHMWPNRALYAARLADAYACAGELDASLAAAEPALLAPRSARSALVMRELHGLYRRLVANWHQEAGVRSLAERLRELDR